MKPRSGFELGFDLRRVAGLRDRVGRGLDDEFDAVDPGSNTFIGEGCAAADRLVTNQRDARPDRLAFEVFSFGPGRLLRLSLIDEVISQIEVRSPFAIAVFLDLYPLGPVAVLRIGSNLLEFGCMLIFIFFSLFLFL